MLQTMCSSYSVITCFCIFFCTTNSAKILGVFPLATRSHFTLGFALMKELADRGHEITLISAFPQNIPIKNIHDISVKGFLEDMKVLRRNLYDLENQSIFATLNYYNTRSSLLTEYVFQNSEVQSLLQSNATFDVVILQQFLNEAFMAFSHHFKAPAVLFCSMGSSFWIYDFFANPAPLSYVPNLFTRFSDKMSFVERLENFLVDTTIKLYAEIIRLPEQNRILNKYFPDAPDVKSLMYNASLVLMNSHISTTSSRPHLPSLVEVGGFHVSKPKRLPNHLQNLMDVSKDGVILFCMGSNLRMSALPDEKVKAILGAFRKLKQTVFLKWEGDELADLPSNVIAAKWLPQQDILGHRANLYDLEHQGVFTTLKLYYRMSGFFSEYLYQQKEVQSLFESNTTFDVIILQQFLNDGHMVFSHYFKAPAIWLCPMGSSFWTYHLFGNPSPPSYVPNLFTRFSEQMTFFERLENSLVEALVFLYRELIIIPNQNNLLKKYFPDAPSIKEMMYNASLVLMNSHTSTTSPRAHMPNMIEIGGFHVGKPQKLPQNLQKFLDEAKDGAVLFCMGSNLKIADFSEDKINALIKSFGRLKEKVLWKWEEDKLPNQPSNVLVDKWMPQRDILAHPNVRAFISHGGLLSTIETIYHGVPIIGIPIFGDQKTNIATAVSNGFAVSVPFQELTEKKLSWALNEILNNTKYKEMAQKRSSIMHDQPLKPMDAAIYWIEYVIRHQGATHFRSAALGLTWYQRNLLDIIAFLTAITIILFYIFYKIIKKILPHKNAEKVDLQKKNK